MNEETAFNIHIGAAIRDARLSRGVSQDDLSQLLGVDRTMISRYERGTRTLSAPALLRIFQYLEYSLTSLDLSPVPTTAPQPTQLSPAVQSIVQMLGQRPDLIPTVEDVLQTFLNADEIERL